MRRQKVSDSPHGMPRLFSFSCSQFSRYFYLRFRPLDHAVSEMGILELLKENNKSESISNRKRVRIILVWCRWWDSPLKSSFACTPCCAPGLLSLPGRAKRSTGPFCFPGFESRRHNQTQRHPPDASVFGGDEGTRTPDLFDVSEAL